MRAASGTSRSRDSRVGSARTSNRTQSNFQNLKQGSRGTRVRTVQRALAAQGHRIAEDGIFGPKTAQAVRDFQRQNNLKVDGIFGPQTLGAMQGTLRQPNGGTRPDAVSTRPSGTAPGNRTARFESTRFEGERRQMKTGSITINGNPYQFRSGGGGRGNLPPGDYKVTPHLWNRSDRSMQVGGEGYSFALSNKYDSRVGGTRTLLRIHPDGAGPGTIGCIGIVGDAATQRRFREDMRAELNRSGGSFTLNVR